MTEVRGPDKAVESFDEMMARARAADPLEALRIMAAFMERKIECAYTVKPDLREWFAWRFVPATTTHGTYMLIGPSGECLCREWDVTPQQRRSA